MKHTYKRLTALVLALAMCFSLLSTTAWAADVETEEEIVTEAVAESAEETGEATEEEETEVEPVEEAAEEPEAEANAEVNAQSTTASGTVGDDNVKWKLSDGTLTISGSGEAGGFNFYTTAPWYDYHSSIKSIVIKDNITGIGYWAFGGLDKVTSVKIGSGVKYIEYGAFEDCTSLKSITIPDSVTSISESFCYCSSLTSVTIGSGVTTIEGYAFGGCTSLKSVTIPANVTTIGDEAFGYYYSSGTKKKISGFTIYGYDDTAAQTYAKSNGFTFVSLGEAAPAAPKISSVKNTSSGVKLSWNKVSGATGYIIYRKSGSSTSYTKVKTITSGSTTSWTDTSAQTNGKKYNYKVKAYKKSDGTTLKSTASSAKSTYRLTSPDISSLKNVKTKKMTVKWKKNSKATGYQIQYSTSSDFSSYKTVTVTSYKTVSKTISSLTKGKKYYVRVRAYKTVSGTKYYSAWSSKKSVKISK